MTETRTNLPESSIDYDQRVAAETYAAATVITGGPTSGETRVVEARMAFLLDADVEPHNILCVVATRNAADNLRRLMNSHPRIAAVGNGIFVARALELSTNLVRSSEMKVWMFRPASVYGQTPARWMS